MQYKTGNSDDLLEQLKAVLRAYETFSQTSDRTLDLSNLRWAPPLEILPLAVLIEQFNLTYTQPKNASCQGYLGHIAFPKGQIGVTLTTNNHIPILKFKTGVTDTFGRTKLEEQIVNLFTKFVGVHPGVMDGIAYSISEMFDNVEEHAQVDYAYIQAQYYPNKQFLDICILDTGISIPGAYKAHGITFSDDVDALNKALTGISTKGDERGTGLRSVLASVRDSFGGEAILISGKAMAQVQPGNKAKVIELPLSWSGTLVLLRIKSQKRGIDFIENLTTNA